MPPRKQNRVAETTTLAAGAASAGEATATPLSAEDAAAKVAALRSGDAAQVTAAAVQISRLLKQVDALGSFLDVGAVPALLALLKSTAPRATLAWPLHALELLTRQAPGRESVRVAEGMPCLLDALSDSAVVLRNCLYDHQFREAFFGHSESIRRVVGALCTAAFAAELNPTTVAALVGCCTHAIEHSRENFATLCDAGVLPPLAKLLGNRQLSPELRAYLFSVVTWMQPLEAVLPEQRNYHVAMYDAGVYTAVVATMQSSRTVLVTGSAQILHKACASASVLPGLRPLLLRQPGALASVALAAADTSTPNHAHTLLRLMQMDHELGNAHASWLLDADYAALAVMEVRGKDDGLVNSFIARWTANIDNCFGLLTRPIPHDELPALVSVALLAASRISHDARFRELLAGGTHLKVLVEAYLAYAGFEGTLDSSADASRRQWHRRAVRAAVRAIAGFVGTSCAADDAEPASKRARTASASLRAEDVNIKRRDSTVFLIGGEPLYVIGALIEAASPVLRDALHAAETLDPIPLPAPHGVPAEQHYALFRAAVEHTYTGSVADVAASQLLPLWCLADHLQMSSLHAWCTMRLRPLLVGDAALLEAAWESALSRSCEVLCSTCARVWLAVLAAEPAEPPSPDANLELLARLEPSCAQGTTTPSQYVVRVLRAALQPPAAAAATAEAR